MSAGAPDAAAPPVDQAGPPDATSPPRYRQSLVLAALAGVNIAGGFLMHWYLLARLGPGVETDALFATLALPQALLAVVASAFINVLVPLLSGDTPIDFNRKAWTFAALTLAAFVAFAVVLALTASWWVPIIAPGLPLGVRSLAEQLARIQLLGMVCTAMAGVLTATNRARRRFYLVEIAPVVSTLVAGAALVVFLPRHGVVAGAWAWVLRIAFNAAMLAPGLGAFRGWTTPEVLTDAWRRIRPLVIGTAYQRTEPVFDRAVVTLGPAGDLSLYYLCQQVCYAAIQLANNALIAPLTPTLATHVRHGQWEAFGRLRRRSATLVGSLAAVAFIGVLALASTWAGGLLPWPVSPVAGRVAALLACLSGLFVAGPVYESVRTAFYSTGRTAAPMRLEAIVYTCGLALKGLGFTAFGALGFAVAASVQTVIGVAAMHRMLVRFERGQRQGDAIP